MGKRTHISVGFWMTEAPGGHRVMEFLSGLHGKKVALFGTCGMGGSSEYFKQVENRVSVFVPEDNDYLGCFLCGGKMMPQVLDRYKQMQAINDSPQIRTTIAAYEEGMLLPHLDYPHIRFALLQWPPPGLPPCRGQWPQPPPP